MKINVGVFFGGNSVEHEISIISAIQAMSAINKEKYNVIPLYLSKKGVFYTGDCLLEVENYKNIDNLLAKSKSVNILNDGKDIIIVKYPINRFGNNVLNKIDVAFPIVHGTNTEDGTIQGFLETTGIPYVGCDVLASSIGMDKIIMKKVLKDSEIPIVEYIYFYSKEWNKNSEELTQKIEEDLKYPVIIKPSNLGSSVGIKKANNRDELEEAVSFAQSFANKIIVERVITNLKEINCSVLGDYEEAQASVCEEPISSEEILSYKDKYLNKGNNKGMSSSTKRLPAEISDEMTNKIQQLATDTFYALGCNGVSRVDFLIDMDTNEVYVNEINTIPGSLSFYLWEATGVTFEELNDKLIQLALKRDREKKKLIFSYESNILSLNRVKGGKN